MSVADTPPASGHGSRLEMTSVTDMGIRLAFEGTCTRLQQSSATARIRCGTIPWLTVGHDAVFQTYHGKAGHDAARHS
jgi:hypothetical protein